MNETPVSGAVLCVGETMAVIAAPVGSSLEEADAVRLDSGGAESNVAVHVALSGHPARWFSRLGDDALGHRVLRHLAEAGVDTSAVITDRDHPTGLYVKDPARGVQYYRRGSAASFLSPHDAERVDVASVRVVHVSGICLLYTSPSPRDS